MFVGFVLMRARLSLLPRCFFRVFFFLCFDVFALFFWLIAFKTLRSAFSGRVLRRGDRPDSGVRLLVYSAVSPFIR